MGVISIVHGIYKATYNWELVDKYYFTFGLMNGGYIELVHGIYKATYNWELVDKYYFTFGLMNGGYIYSSWDL